MDLSWIHAHGRDPKVRIVEVDVDTNAYSSGHIPGAIAFNWQTQLQDPVRRDVVSREDLERLLGQAGIDRETTVILYGDHNNWFAAYAYWLLRYYGHTKVKLLNGGRKKWLAEGRPLEMEVLRSEPVTYRVQETQPKLRAHRDEMHSVVPGVTSGAALVDVRSEAEYTGEIFAPPGLSETAQRAGHIPGAVNVPWSKAANEDGTFKSVANYDGSWTEWGSMIGVPVERGTPVLAGAA